MKKVCLMLITAVLLIVVIPEVSRAQSQLTLIQKQEAPFGMRGYICLTIDSVQTIVPGILWEYLAINSRGQYQSFYSLSDSLFYELRHRRPIGTCVVLEGRLVNRAFIDQCLVFAKQSIKDRRQLRSIKKNLEELLSESPYMIRNFGYGTQEDVLNRLNTIKLSTAPVQAPQKTPSGWR